MLFDHIPFPSATRPAALAALMALSGAGLGGCYTTTGPVSAPTTATVSTSAWFPSSGAPKCVAGATWTYQLLSATGTDGSGDSIREDQPMKDFFPTNGRCVVSDFEPAHGFQPPLRAGRWRISVLLGVASNTCDVDLHNGGNTVTFTYGISGC
jgi:hypothetical protein